MVEVQVKKKRRRIEGDNAHEANMYPNSLKWLDLVKWKQVKKMAVKVLYSYQCGQLAVNWREWITDRALQLYWQPLYLMSNLKLFLNSFRIEVKRKNKI